MTRKLNAYMISLMLLISLAALTTPLQAQATSTSDPNHKGWSGKHPRMKQVAWKPVEAKCDACKKTVAQYNETVSQLLNSRYWVKFWQEVHKNREKGKADPFWPGKGDITDFEGKAVGANLELFELQNQQLQLHNKLVSMLERQANYLRFVISECERTACPKSKPSKIKAIKIGGAGGNETFQPDHRQILSIYKVDWKGPYTTQCLPCRSIVSQLNAVPGWISRAHMKLQQAELQLEYSKLINKSNKIKLDFLQYQHPDKTDYSQLESKVKQLRKEIDALADYFKKLLQQLQQCEQKFCPATADGHISIGDNYETVSLQPLSNCPIVDATQPIDVGPNNEVGSRAKFKEKAKKKAAGVAGKVIGGLLGGGRSSSGGGTEGPTTYKDPVRNKHKLEVKNKPEKRELKTGAIFTEDGLLVSTDIKKAPGKGTFQTVYLENPRGWQLQPIALFLYEIWQDWKLSVSWTRDTYIDGEHVKHEEGGWTEEWSVLIAKGEEVIYAQVQAIWKQLGFNTAVSGARSLGTLFPVSPEMLAAEPINLVIHITDPDHDPVVTVPYIFLLSLDGEKINVEEVEQTIAGLNDPCS